ncbi:MAG: response regulator [Candidatus Omnitrophica bacterium]|nr:response regulator [Candidatus Omnitrophota bacterium]
MAKKILVVDDDATGRVLMNSRLAKEGFEVMVAGNGYEGLEQVKRNKPDFIILDIEMPEMNGYTFVLELKKIDGCQDIPMAVLTSHKENKAIFARRGVQHYFVKPVNFDELIPQIVDLVGK